MIPYLEHHIVDQCNLKCNGCSHFSSLAPEWFEDINDFINDFSQLYRITNGQVRIIRLMGGEPLLHPQVGTFLEVARQLFPNSEIQLVTNGLLLKKRKDELVDIINRNNIRVCVSNYGIIPDLYETLAAFQNHRVDGKTNMYNISFDLTGSQNMIKSFTKCDLHIYHWYYFQNGKFYPCCIGANVAVFNKHFNKSLPEPTGYSVYKYTEQEIIQLLNTPISLCEYCDTNKRLSEYHKFSVSKGDIKEWICQ